MQWFTISEIYFLTQAGDNGQYGTMMIMIIVVKVITNDNNYGDGFDNDDDNDGVVEHVC